MKKSCVLAAALVLAAAAVWAAPATRTFRIVSYA